MQLIADICTEKYTIRRNIHLYVFKIEVISCHRVSKISSGYTTSLTRTKRLLKMSQRMYLMYTPDIIQCVCVCVVRDYSNVVVVTGSLRVWMQMQRQPKRTKQARGQTTVKETRIKLVNYAGTQTQNQNIDRT